MKLTNCFLSIVACVSLSVVSVLPRSAEAVVFTDGGDEIPRRLIMLGVTLSGEWGKSGFSHGIGIEASFIRADSPWQVDAGAVFTSKRRLRMYGEIEALGSATGVGVGPFVEIGGEGKIPVVLGLQSTLFAWHPLLGVAYARPRLGSDLSPAIEVGHMAKLPIPLDSN